LILPPSAHKLEYQNIFKNPTGRPPTNMANTAASRLFRNSLQGRLLLATLLCLPLFLSLSAYLLDRAFQQSLEDSEAEQLQTQLYILLSATEWQDDQLWLPEELAEPKFSAPESDLFAYISDEQGALFWQSNSALYIDEKLPTDKSIMELGVERFSRENTVNDLNHEHTSAFFRYRYDLVWEAENGDEQILRFQIFHQLTSYKAKLRNYRRQLLFSLLLFAAGLITTQLLINRWGLHPLSHLAREINALKNSEKQTLDGDYPAEIQPVTDSLNQVLSSEQQQRERYKNTLGDLAHSLKTPLAVMQGELGQQHTDLAAQQQSNIILGDQLQRMDAIIRHQLQRAVISTPNAMHKKVTLKPIAERLIAAMGKVYRDKNIAFSTDIDEMLTLAADSQDVFEVMGNLVENACKYGRKNVSVRASEHRSGLNISIEDDGPGVPAELQRKILERGARADTAQPGQGIGLSVATDIISAYSGSIECSTSSLGGAKFTLWLPS